MSQRLSHSESMAVLLSTALRHLETCKDALAGAQDELRSAVAAERERCAKIADEYRAKCLARGPSWDDQAMAAGSIAARIRSGA